MANIRTLKNTKKSTMDKRCYKLRTEKHMGRQKQRLTFGTEDGLGIAPKKTEQMIRFCGDYREMNKFICARHVEQSHGLATHLIYA
jgi:hypothetical protein